MYLCRNPSRDRGLSLAEIPPTPFQIPIYRDWTINTIWTPYVPDQHSNTRLVTNWKYSQLVIFLFASMNASSNDHSNAPPTDSEASSTRIDKPNQAKPGYMTRSSSYIEPRTFEMYAQYLDPVKKMQGVVEKQSRKCPNVWVCIIGHQNDDDDVPKISLNIRTECRKRDGCIWVIMARPFVWRKRL